MSITATATTAVRIGSVRLTGDIKTSDSYETAAWYRNFTSEAGQVVDLIATPNARPDYYRPGTFMVNAVASGVCTGSNFTSLWGGMPIGAGKVNEEVGKIEDRTVLSVTDHFITDLLAGLVNAPEGIEITVDEEALSSLGLGTTQKSIKGAITRDRDRKVMHAKSAHRSYLDACMALCEIQAAQHFEAPADAREESRLRSAKSQVVSALSRRNALHEELVARYPELAWRTQAIH